MCEETKLLSRRIHQFLCEFHKLLFGSNKGPYAQAWARTRVVDDYRLLGNSEQTIGGMDCGAHTCIVPVLRQANIPLSVMDIDKEKTSKEMRERLTLSLVRNEWFFKIDEIRVNKMKNDRGHVDHSDMTKRLNDLGRYVGSEARKRKAELDAQQKVENGNSKKKNT